MAITPLPNEQDLLYFLNRINSTFLYMDGN